MSRLTLYGLGYWVPGGGQPLGPDMTCPGSREVILSVLQTKIGKKYSLWSKGVSRLTLDGLGPWVPGCLGVFAPWVQKLCPVSHELAFRVIVTKLGTCIHTDSWVCRDSLWVVCAHGVLGARVLAPGAQNVVSGLSQSLFSVT